MVRPNPGTRRPIILLNTLLFFLLLCATPSPLNGLRANASAKDNSISAGVRGEAVRLISAFMGRCENAIQSQRDCVTQPRHLRNELFAKRNIVTVVLVLPWENEVEESNPERVVASSDDRRITKNRLERGRLEFATHHPEGMADNSPTFQRWELQRGELSPEGTAETAPWSAVPPGLMARSDDVLDRSADFPVRSNARTFYGSEKLYTTFIPRCCGLESPRSVIEPTVSGAWINEPGHNPIGVAEDRRRLPRVKPEQQLRCSASRKARPSQPWALLRNPVGILRRSGTLRCSGVRQTTVQQIDWAGASAPPADWPAVLRDMPFDGEIVLNRDNSIPLMLRAFQSNSVVKALIFLPGVADDFYLVSRDQPKLNIRATNLLAAITALTNATAVRATFQSGFLLLHLERDNLQPKIKIENKPTAARLNTQSHLPRALWIDAHWEKVQPELSEALKLKILPAPKSRDAWHFARHNLAAWNLTDGELLAALSLAEKTTISIQKNKLVFRLYLNR